MLRASHLWCISAGFLLGFTPSDSAVRAQGVALDDFVETTTEIVAHAEWSDTSCMIGEECQLEGLLNILYPENPRWGAWISLGDGTCIAILMPPEYFTERVDWALKLVRVRGLTLEQPKGIDNQGRLVLSYSYEGRASHGNLCRSDFMIYTYEIELVEE